MNIQNLSPEYIDGVVALENECFAHPWTRDAILEYYGNPDAYFFVALEGNEVVGYIGTYMVMDECFVTNLAVTENNRRQGIGNALILEATRNARSNGASFITLEVRVSNGAAISVYGKNEFITEGIRKGFYRDPDEDALIMTRRF
ncbi:MAG: ribosomal protein S18-alanine N-acetyltransferase [Clostridia bacterium]|nr:ribosomal protein S18-alanine N-acetyltransferase [Clostridia bacterium]